MTPETANDNLIGASEKLDQCIREIDAAVKRLDNLGLEYFSKNMAATKAKLDQVRIVMTGVQDALEIALKFAEAHQ